jgi:pimeloyl-ACP methyl ester carboxylesterase
MTERLEVDGIGTVELTYSERGAGLPVLLLHGGAGPMSVVPWAELLARTHPVRVLTPTHPGFMGTPLPEGLRSVRGVAQVYASFLDRLGLEDVTVIGNSVGGWIAAELALASPLRVRRLVLVDAPGPEVPGHAVVDPFSLPFDEIGRRSYHDPARFGLDPAKLSPQQRAGMAANMATLKRISGSLQDPTLASRLQGLRVPTLVAWGDSDRMIDPEVGRAYARAIPGATFHLMPGTGHLPQIETPEALLELVGPFVRPHRSP